MIDATKLKVCFLAGTLGRGGAERQLVYMLRALKHAGIQLRVLCLTRGEFFESEIQRLGVNVEYIGAGGSKPARLYRIINSLRREPADIVQSVHFFTNLYTAVSARFVGALGIGAIRNDLTSEELRINGVYGRGHLHLPKHLIANSALARERAIEHGVLPERVDLVANAVDVESFRWKQNGNHRSAVQVLFVGRLVEQKRPDLFLRVVANLAQRCAERTVKAKVIGEGPMRPQLQALATRLGLGPDRLELIDKCDDMGSAYGQADLVLLTSGWEGTPNVLLEAMACGVPVVATRVGGVPEIAGCNRALLADPGDENGLTVAAFKLLQNQNLRRELGRRAAEYVARFHSVERLELQLTNIYRKALAA
jgi:glycosyltransferase involved in cell wall biosynthesis